MHVLIIPSEEFVPTDNHLAGIFQFHQAKMLQNAGFKIGVISIKQSLSIPMIFKAMLFKVFGKKTANALKETPLRKLPGLLLKKIFFVDQFISIEEVENIPVIRINGFYYLPPKESRNYYGWGKAGLAAFEKYIELNGKPDLIHAHNALFAGMLATKIKRRYSVPFLITEHSSFVARNLILKSLLPAVKDAYNSADSFLVVSAFLGQKLDEVFDNKLHKWNCVPNVLDPFFEKAEEPLMLESAKAPFIFISIGSLIPVKGNLELIEAFKEAFSGSPDFILKIAGDGELKSMLEKRILELGLSNCVFLLDRLNRCQVLSLIDQSHSLILTSHFETFGVVLIEALSRGKPVIATNCGGPGSIVNKRNGILCIPKNVLSVSTALQQMRNNYVTYDHAMIRRDALAKYGEDSFINEMDIEYNNILKN